MRPLIAPLFWFPLLLRTVVLFAGLEGAEITGIVDPPEQPRQRRQAAQYGGVQPGAVEPRPDPRAVIYLINERTQSLPLQTDRVYELVQRGLQFFPRFCRFK